MTEHTTPCGCCLTLEDHLRILREWEDEYLARILPLRDTDEDEYDREYDEHLENLHTAVAVLLEDNPT